MVVPWTGFPLKQLVDLAKPLSSAKYVRFETFLDPEMAPGQKPSIFGYSSMPWPYVEGLTMAEATNDLTLMVTGAYGKPVAKSMGAPIRLHVPWKYGFKSIKSIVRIELTETMPETTWNMLAPDEYGFYANVNPAVDHPRWSQARERRLPNSFFDPNWMPTQPFNGYPEVASLYKGMDLSKFY